MSGNYQIKKTPDLLCIFGKSGSGGDAFLNEGYEELRAYVVSPAKTPLHPLGLDLWLKKGFLSWSAVMLRKETQPPASASARSENADISDGLITSLANILAEWSVKNVRQ